MVLKIVLLLTIIIQIIAAIVSLRLTKRTKYNLSWVFISLGFGSLLMRMILESLPFYFDVEPRYYRMFYIWVGVSSATFFAIGLLLIRKIFDYMDRIEKEKRAGEKKILSIMVQAEELERKRLAKDLHDGLGPLLSTVKMSVSALKKQKNSDYSKEILDNIDNVIVESIRSIKEISNNLSPHVLENFGLKKAITNFLQKINMTKTFDVNYESNINGLRFDQNIESVLYRVVCELVNNTVKHANASKISISLNHEANIIRLIFIDNGKGFEIENLLLSDGKETGIYNIQSRVGAVKGKVSFSSILEKGTEVVIQIPLEHEERE